MPHAAKDSPERLEVGEPGELALKEGHTDVIAAQSFEDGRQAAIIAAKSPGVAGATPPSAADSGDQDAVSVAASPCSKTDLDAAEAEGRPLAEASSGCGAAGMLGAYAAEGQAGPPAPLQHAAAPPSTSPSAASSVRLTFSAPPKCLQGLPSILPRTDFSHSRLRVRQIRQDNATLVKRLGEIAGKAPALEKTQAKMDRFRANVAASRASRRQGEAARIMAQNLAIYRRLQEIKPSRDVERGRQERDFAAHEATLERLAALRRRAGAEWEGATGKSTAGSASPQGAALAAAAN